MDHDGKNGWGFRGRTEESLQKSTSEGVKNRIAGLEFRSPDEESLIASKLSHKGFDFLFKKKVVSKYSRLTRSELAESVTRHFDQLERELAANKAEMLALEDQLFYLHDLRK